ncbi:hypothetical protein HYZ99_02640 [Candidatus Peregrinibacteria bacterium]|nr:hypothetical protein [Candidatus Peregrinibacteria bacterium]
MPFALKSLRVQLPLVLLGCLALFGLWMMPIVATGMPLEIPRLLAARNFAETGMFRETDSLGRLLAPELLKEQGETSPEPERLSTMILATFSRFIPWNNAIGWTAMTGAVFALSFLFLWLAVARLFSIRVAWGTIVITALMPIYWQIALSSDRYIFGLFFLFAGFAAAAWLLDRSWIAAVIVSGIFFGLAASAKDAFLIFLPWFLVLLVSVQRSWKRGIVAAALFLACTGIVYLIPYADDIRSVGYPVNQNIARAWPGAADIEEKTYLHLYPDPYTYFFDRERFDRELLARRETLSFLERTQLQKVLIRYGVGGPSLIDSVLNGVWLFGNSVTSLFQQDVMGGIVLWLFILPGIYVLRRRRVLLLFLLGTIASVHVLTSFVLHYSREHLMDYGWALGLLVAVGIAFVADSLSASQKKFSAATITSLIILILAVQMIQANRTRFARFYARSLVADTVAAAEVMEKLPAEAVVAAPLHPRIAEDLALLSGQSVVLFQEPTVERLLSEGKLDDAFRTYGVTHVLRYDDERARRMRAAANITVLVDPHPGPKPPEHSAILRYLLHTIR